MTAARTRARRGEGERLRDEILDVAEELLVSTGDENAVSIRAIAQRVGVTPPSIYLHFADKESLLWAVCERQFAKFDAVLEAASATTDDPIEALRRRGEAYARFGLEHPDAYRMMFMARPTVADRHAATIDRSGGSAFTHHVEAVQRAIDTGALRPDLDALQVAIFTWSGMHGITSLLISLASFPWPDREQLVRGMCALQLRALKAEP
ncbi:MAG TPA: TetR/AcrR family transcriptional regulator [Acidimicrobiia bacterium]|nr:TetR/AcrR family transcriptional regulator [Acidimicrobiia bacterium]